MTRLLRTVVHITTLLFLIQAHGIAEWPYRSDSSVCVVAQPGNQWNARLVSDQQNGTIITWQDRRSGSGDQLYVQRLSSAGLPLWKQDGIQISTAGGYQYYPQIVASGSGSATIVWQDNRSGIDYDIFVQRIGSGGIAAWNANGTTVCDAPGHQYNPQLISDGAGGVIIAWQDRRNNNFDIFIQRFGSAGNPMWTLNGAAVCTAPSDQVDPRIVSDGAGGAIVSWVDYRSGTGSADVYAARVLSTGQIAWTSNGNPVCTATNNQASVQIVSDLSGGAILCWQDRRSGTIDNIYAQRINSNGTIMWATDGIPVAPTLGIQYTPQMMSDGLAGAVIVWQDNRSGSDYDIYGQRLDNAGQLLWGSTGIAVCVAAGSQYAPQLVVQSPSILVTWQDRRSGTYDVYAQRLNIQGQRQWDQAGVAISTQPFDQFMPQLASDSLQGAILAWTDYHLNAGATDVFAQRIGANGVLAGGAYRTFTQADYATKGVRFRRTARPYIIAMPTAGNVRDSIQRRGALPYGLLIGYEPSSTAQRWGCVTFSRGSAIRRALPQTGTPRPFDRLSYDQNFIRPLRNPSITRYNNRLVGELATLKLNISASDVGLLPERFGDLIFKDTAKLANPLSGKNLRKLTETVDSMLTFYQKFPGVSYSQMANTLERINTAFSGPLETASCIPLRIAATRSLFTIPFLVPSTEPPTVLPSYQEMVDVSTLPEEFELSQNYPNPFNPVTTIEFSVPEQSFVTLQLMNLLGQVVLTPLDHSLMDDGFEVLDIDASKLASGAYFYRMSMETTSGRMLKSQTKKMLLVK